MLKQYIYIVIIFFSLSSCAQNKVTFYSKEQKIYPKINIPLSADIQVERAANEFSDNFKTITGQSLIIERSNNLNKNYNYIVLRINPTQKYNYCIYKEDKNITIQAVSAQNLAYGVNDFFKYSISVVLSDETNWFKTLNQRLVIITTNDDHFCFCEFEYV